MTDKELADRIVGYGIGEETNLSGWYRFDAFGESGVSADKLTNDWRVAGAMIDLLDNPDLHIWQEHYENNNETLWVVELPNLAYTAINKSLPRAIIEAADKALRDE